MKAQWLRFLVTLLGMAAAGLAFMTIDGWAAWLAAAAILAVAGTIAEALFRRLADQETRRADLEERVRNSSP